MSKLLRSGLPARITTNQNTVVNLERRLITVTQATVQTHRQQVQSLASALDSLSPLRTLGRGYAYVTSTGGVMLHHVTDYQRGDHVILHVDRGAVTATVDEVRPQEDDKND